MAGPRRDGITWYKMAARRRTAATRAGISSLARRWSWRDRGRKTSGLAHAPLFATPCWSCPERLCFRGDSCKFVGCVWSPSRRSRSPGCAAATGRGSCGCASTSSPRRESHTRAAETYCIWARDTWSSCGPCGVCVETSTTSGCLWRPSRVTAHRPSEPCRRWAVPRACTAGAPGRSLWAAGTRKFNVSSHKFTLSLNKFKLTLNKFKVSSKKWVDCREKRWSTNTYKVMFLIIRPFLAAFLNLFRKRYDVANKTYVFRLISQLRRINVSLLKIVI